MLSEKIKTFLVVADTLSFTKAGKILYLSPVAVMKQINLLEDKLNCSLFVRNNSGLKLTKAGLYLKENAKNVVNDVYNIVNNITEINKRDIKHILRIGCSINYPITFLDNFLFSYNEVRNNFKFEVVIYENNNESFIDTVKTLGQDVDIIGTIYDEKFIAKTQFNGFKLRSLEVKLSVPLDHELAHKNSITINDLKDQKIMIFIKGAYEAFDKYRAQLEAIGCEIISFDFFSYKLFNEALEKNYLVLSYEDLMIKHPEFKLIDLEDKLKISFGIVYNKVASKNVESFINLLNVSKI